MSPQKSFLVSFLVLVFLSNVFCYKILAIFPHPGKSHVDVFLPLMKELAKKGHEVTVISHFPNKQPQERYRDINLEDTIDDLFVHALALQRVASSKRYRRYLLVQDMFKFVVQFCEYGLKSKQISELVASNETFDLIIAEFFHTDCYLGFVDKFKAPVIGLSSCVIPAWVNPQFGNPDNPAYVPNLSMDFSNKMSFFERLENAVAAFVQTLSHRELINEYDIKQIRKYFANFKTSFDKLRLQPSLLLVNSHFSLNFPRPLVPSIIEVGGVHLGEHRIIPQDRTKRELLLQKKHDNLDPRGCDPDSLFLNN